MHNMQGLSSARHYVLSSDCFTNTVATKLMTHDIWTGWPESDTHTDTMSEYEVAGLGS